MKWFSQRKGLKKSRVEIQIESMDDALRNRLWNVFFPHYLYGLNEYDWRIQGIRIFVTRFWDEYLKLTTIEAPNETTAIMSDLMKYFFKCDWNEVYDFLETIVDYFPSEEYNRDFIKKCNNVLESELAGYRFVGKEISPVTSEKEIAEIDEALSSPLKSVNLHLENSLRLFSDKTKPDYINSIKESISAVEAICKLISKNEKTDLHGALAIIETQGKINIHPALRRAFINLYGYTSDADGIRHALKEEKVNSDFDEAKFMLVTCSAFVNYLISKSAKAGIKI